MAPPPIVDEEGFGGGAHIWLRGVGRAAAEGGPSDGRKPCGGVPDAG